MPALPYSEEHALFRETVRRFVADEVAPHHARWEAEGVVDRELWRRAAGPVPPGCC